MRNRNWLSGLTSRCRRPAASVGAPVAAQCEGLETRALLSGGNLDATFGVGGVVFTDLFGGSDSANAVQVQADGKIVVAGPSFGGGGLVRYLPNGNLDPTFSFSDGAYLGKVFVGGVNVINDLLIQPDGRILVAGNSLSAEGTRTPVLVRLLENGRPDIGFGNNGRSEDLTALGQDFRAIALAADGDIVAVGNNVSEDPNQPARVARYRSNGSLDPAFATGGVLALELGAGRDVLSAVAIEPDGQIVIAGNGPTEQRLIRLNPDGTFDQSFGVGGVVVDHIQPSGFTTLTDMTVLPDDRLLAASIVGGANTLTRYHANGARDLSFSYDGKVAPNFTGFLGTLELAVDDQGRAIMASESNASTGAMSLVRVLPNGEVDESFGERGFFQANLGFFAFACALQPDGQIVVAGRSLFRESADFAVARFEGGFTPPQIVVTGTDVGDPPTVRVLNAITGEELVSFSAFVGTFRGGVRVASGDFDGDGMQDVAVAMGGAAGVPSRLRIISLAQLPNLTDLVGAAGIGGGILPLGNTYVGGLNIAAGDVNGDGVDEIIVSPDSNSRPDVRVFAVQPPGDGNLFGTLANVRTFRAYVAAYRNGVRVAAGDVNGDGRDDIITSRVRGTPNVRVFDGLSGRQFSGRIGSFNAFSREFRGGVYVAAGDINGDGRADIIASAGAGGAPTVRVFNGLTGLQLASFDAYDATFRGGVRVAVGDVNGDGRLDILTAPGVGIDAEIRYFDGVLDELDSFFIAESTTRRGLFLGASR